MYIPSLKLIISIKFKFIDLSNQKNKKLNNHDKLIPYSSIRKTKYTYSYINITSVVNNNSDDTESTDNGYFTRNFNSDDINLNEYKKYQKVKDVLDSAKSELASRKKFCHEENLILNMYIDSVKFKNYKFDTYKLYGNYYHL